MARPTRTAAIPEPPEGGAGPSPLFAQVIAEQRGREPFVPLDRYIPTGFACRLEALMEHAYATGSWFLFTAFPGDGKSTALEHFEGAHAPSREPGGDGSSTRIVPVLSTRVSSGVQSTDRLVGALADELGAVPRIGPSRTRAWLVGAIVRAKVRMIVIDDAHELRLGQLSYLRELTDQLKRRGVRPSVVLLAAVNSKEPRSCDPWRLIVKDPLVAEQFRRRLNGPDPVVRVAGLSEAEVGRVLRTWELQYAPAFPELALARWAGSLFTWLTDKRNDTAGAGRARMKQLAEVVHAALGLAWAEERPGNAHDGMDLYDAALRLTVRGDASPVFDVDLDELRRAS